MADAVTPVILVFFLKSENVNAENSSTAPRNGL